MCRAPQRRTFGMDTGCGIGDNAVNFAYGKALAARPVLSAGVVIDGVPYHHVMPIGPGQKYHESKFRVVA